ncbi:MAG: hypothetical protein JW700_03860 [Candidatus Aenigmarchaeota archaeon]|nr:hypothetical protein [Candidatus Aenigmarchaeota archaeon]
MSERKSIHSKLKGSSRKEYVENISFMIIVLSSVMVASGIFLGSFIQGTVFIASFGSMFVMVGITVYIVSQFIGVNNG